MIIITKKYSKKHREKLSHFRREFKKDVKGNSSSGIWWFYSIKDMMNMKIYIREHIKVGWW